mmetsp:Transcript_9345/g.14078  ORF Transcript_9345/g.14078 Transcript_9345/m.14078 type:complete len:274 (-) Transcript_9345:130-951(-)|eukprot:CAMPEP_0171460016 /NCGR_PEP_ID=MMETSP0945-20130129/5054_1 /TAXON_ID=109269 /ORGANISM="Vaucheria litorea, Strain CCMP2940" /LENGTH=273 /DNA_ID=CAMNT_0011986121 /DNA_START=124 /DNA_END=945 /DNA_ORIENTATION=+
MIRSKLAFQKYYNAKLIHSKSGKSEGAGRKQGAFLFSLLVGSTAGLGFWQLDRYQWKERLIEDKKRRLEMSPINISSLEKNGDEIGRRVRLDGIFDCNNSVLVGLRSAPKSSQNQKTGMVTSPMGYYIYTPFIGKDGVISVVNRGWKPQNAKDFCQTSATEIVGLVREGEKKNRYSPEHDVKSIKNNKLIWVDLEAMKKLMKIEDDVLLVDQLEEKCSEVDSEGLFVPIKKSASDVLDFYVMPETHLMYAATWFSLAGFASAITFIRFRKKLK